MSTSLQPLVLFDIDGTLLHTTGAGIRALKRMFDTEFGCPDPFADYSFSGRTDPGILRDAFQRCFGRDPTPDEKDRAVASYLGFLDEELSGSDVKVLPGVVPLLDRLVQEGIPTGLATGNVEAGARLKLSAAGILHYFRFGGYGSDAEHRGELTRTGIARGRALAGPVPDELVVIVGDSPLDVSAARYAGVRCLAVMTGWTSREEMEAAAPDLLLDDLSDLARVMGFLLGAPTASSTCGIPTARDPRTGPG
jgi:phosphoglycolate phosphatase-like HAD superfamily hydrolase